MVKVIHYERANKNKTIGYADILIPIMKPTVIILRKVAHVQSGDRRWFNSPSFAREDAQGNTTYLKYFEFETQVHNGQLMEQLSEPVKQYCTAYGIEEVAPMNFESFPDFNHKNAEVPF